jgi:hypothetical protein
MGLRSALLPTGILSNTYDASMLWGCTEDSATRIASQRAGRVHMGAAEARRGELLGYDAMGAVAAAWGKEDGLLHPWIGSGLCCGEEEQGGRWAEEMGAGSSAMARTEKEEGDVLLLGAGKGKLQGVAPWGGVELERRPWRRVGRRRAPRELGHGWTRLPRKRREQGRHGKLQVGGRRERGAMGGSSARAGARRPWSFWPCAPASCCREEERRLLLCVGETGRGSGG